MMAPALLASVSALASSRLSATPIDPSMPTTIVVGASPGFAPMARVDGARRGQAKSSLPGRPRVLWQQRSRTGYDVLPLAVDTAGAIVTAPANVPGLIQLSRDGREQWRSAPAMAPAVTGPVILNDATRLVVDAAGDAVGFSPDGALRFRTPIDAPERNVRFAALPLDEGGASISGGSEIVDIDGLGNIDGRSPLPVRIAGPLVSTQLGQVAVGANGAVYGRKYGVVRSLGSLGGDPGEGGASTPDGRSLYAVIDNKKIVALDLLTGHTEIRWSVTDQSLHGPVVFGNADAPTIVTLRGVLLTFSGQEREPRRVPLEAPPATLLTDAGQVDFAALDESPPPVTDADGRVGFARVGGRIGIVSSEGEVLGATGPSCHSPSALAPAGPGRMVVACRDGTLLLLGDTP